MKEVIENPFDKVSDNGNAIIAESDLQPLDWALFAKQAGLRGTPIKAEELVGKTFDIMRAKQQESAYEGQEHFWFCIVRPAGQDELFETVLGGGAVMEILDAYAKSGVKNPLRVTLDFVKGGRFKGYYQFK